MNLTNRKFKNNTTGQVALIIDSFEHIAFDSNKKKYTVSELLDSSKYTEIVENNNYSNSEQIDPNSFFNQTPYSSITSQLMNIPTDNLRDDVPQTIEVKLDPSMPKPTTDEPAIISYDQESEIRELERKYNLNNNSALTEAQKQNELLSQYVDEEDINFEQNETIKTVILNREEPRDIKINNNTNNITSQRIDNHYQEPIKDDPITSMFRNVKRNLDFKFELEISNKIPRLDFIEMMEDSYEVSIIDFLANEFTNKLLENPELIKSTIADNIKKMVYGADIKKKVETNTDQTTNDITENITSSDIKPIKRRTTTRTTRTPKKETN